MFIMIDIFHFGSDLRFSRSTGQWPRSSSSPTPSSASPLPPLFPSVALSFLFILYFFLIYYFLIDFMSSCLKSARKEALLRPQRRPQSLVARRRLRLLHQLRPRLLLPHQSFTMYPILLFSVIIILCQCLFIVKNHLYAFLLLYSFPDPRSSLP